MNYIATMTEDTYYGLVAEYGEDRVEQNLDPERFLSESDLGGDADHDFPVWTASDAEAWDEWLRMTEDAAREHMLGL